MENLQLILNFEFVNLFNTMLIFIAYIVSYQIYKGIFKCQISYQEFVKKFIYLLYII